MAKETEKRAYFLYARFSVSFSKVTAERTSMLHFAERGNSRGSPASISSTPGTSPEHPRSHRDLLQ
ncbi:MAG TPA: hypothetical protein VGF67_22700, partial [Ktedonobacteraceae bacterium]